MLWSRPEVIEAWKGWRQQKSKRKKQIKRGREFSDLPDTKPNAKEREESQSLLRYEPYDLGENYNKIFYSVGQNYNKIFYSADNIISEGTDI